MTMLFCLAGLSAFAADPVPAVSVKEHQAAITRALTEHRTAVLTLDLKKMLTLCSKNYRETTRDGRLLTYGDFLKIAKAFDLLRSSDDLETVMENAMIIQNEKLNDRRKEYISSLKKTAKARETIENMRKKLDELTAAGGAAAQYIRVSDIRIDGEKAFAVCELQLPDDPEPYRCCYELILHRGQWLIQQVK